MCQCQSALPHSLPAPAPAPLNAQRHHALQAARYRRCQKGGGRGGRHAPCLIGAANEDPAAHSLPSRPALRVVSLRNDDYKFAAHRLARCAALRPPTAVTGRRPPRRLLLAGE